MFAAVVIVVAGGGGGGVVRIEGEEGLGDDREVDRVS